MANPTFPRAHPCWVSPAALLAMARRRLRPAVGAVTACVIALSGMTQAQAQSLFDPKTGLVDLDAVDWSQVVNDVEDYPGITLFEMPRFTRELSVIAGRAATGDDVAALRLVDRMLGRYPLIAELHATRGLLLARLERIEDALTAIDVAMDLGYGKLSEIRRVPGFTELTDHRRFRRIAGKARKPVPLEPVPQRPTQVDGQTALVSALNTQWDPRRQLLSAAFILPDDIDTRAPIWDQNNDGKPNKRNGLQPTGALARLPDRIRSGEAAGLGGVFYDNRDRDHSGLMRKKYPRMTFIEYADAAKAASIDYGPNRSMHFDGIVIGNSSTALTKGPFGRSQARSLMTGPGDMAQQTRQFVRNQLYVFPEVRDYDPNVDQPDTKQARMARGDRFPALAPYFVISQGSSGSDRPFLEAMANILAAMNAEMRAELVSRRLIAPTLHMILRRGMKGVGDDVERYLDGAAHRPVLDRKDIDLEKMVAITERLTAADVPPMPAIVVDQDFDAQSDVEVFGDGLSEVLFDTPFAVGRIWRSTEYSRRMVLRAGVAELRPGQDVTLEWRVLQGQDDKVRIRKLSANGERVVIEIDWHGRYLVPGRDDMTTDRVDIGVFARVGDEVSIPATVSVVFPSRQERVYEPGPDGEMRLTAVDYAPKLPKNVYMDPLIFAERPWRDFLEWEEDGTLAGWRRAHHNYRSEEYTGNGLLIRSRDVKGRPKVLESMDYPTERKARGTLRVAAVPTGERFEVIYPSDTARDGALVPADREGLPDDPGAEEAGAAD